VNSNKFFDNYSNQKVLVIAEIGVNHDGLIEKAIDLVDQAKACGADAVKFQLFSAEKLAHFSTPKVNYQKITDKHVNHFSMLKNLEFSRNQHQIVQEYCKKNDILFSTTAYDVSDIDFLVSLEVPFIKIASADIVDMPLISKASQAKIPLIISTGMATEIEINKTLQVLKLNKSDFCLLHCTSEYPTIESHVFMNRIDHIKRVSNENFGYSDHTITHIASLLAIAKGARVIEKHFTLDKSAPGPDHAASANVVEFKEFVHAIRSAEKMFGDGKFYRTNDEEDMARTSRKSLYLSKSLKKGDVVESSNFYLRRPGNGLSGQEIENICGLKARYNLPQGHKIAMEDLTDD
jgi:N,N'-diacetyllegionaminate synthase